jgi:ribonuclease R
VFDAVIGKCTRYGLFVDLPALAIGGMVHISKIADDFVRFDEFHETLAGGGRTWAVGGKLKVRVEKVDFDRRQIDFAPVAARAGKGDRPSRGRKATKKELPKPVRREQSRRRKGR